MDSTQRHHYTYTKFMYCLYCYTEWRLCCPFQSLLKNWINLINIILNIFYHSQSQQRTLQCTYYQERTYRDYDSSTGTHLLWKYQHITGIVCRESVGNRPAGSEDWTVTVGLTQNVFQNSRSIKENQCPQKPADLNPHRFLSHDKSIMITNLHKFTKL